MNCLAIGREGYEWEVTKVNATYRDWLVVSAAENLEFWPIFLDLL